LPTEAVLHAIRNDAELAIGFLTDASQARRRSIDTIADLAFAHVLQRVAKFLLSYAPATTGMAKGLSGIENLSQAQIAAAAGTVRDMAARALLRLKNAGSVELDRGVRVQRSSAARLTRYVVASTASRVAASSCASNATRFDFAAASATGCAARGTSAS
jgi:CRP-like cAMP-binding protein